MYAVLLTLPQITRGMLLMNLIAVILTYKQLIAIQSSTLHAKVHISYTVPGL